MIYGIGTDLCDVGRIEKSIARPAFLQHVYTPAEQELIVAHTGKKQAETAAANFAAKEAFFESLRHRPFRVLHGGNRRPAPAKRCALPGIYR